MKIGSNTIKMITPIELASSLHISRTSVYRLIDQRKIPFYKIKGSIRFKQDDVMNYLENSRIEPIQNNTI